MSAQHEWLNLLEVSGPFLASPVLQKEFPQGLEVLDPSRAKRLRRTYEEWRDAVDGEDADRDKLHAAWVDEVLRTALEADDQLLKPGKDLPASVVELPEHDTILAPEFAFVDPTHGGTMLAPIHVFPPDTDLSASMKFGGLSCSPADRMALHLRMLSVPIGIVTNGERWMLVHAPTGQVATFASWYARFFGQEPETLRAFASLLGVRRFFAPEQDRLPALFEQSLNHQNGVTDALGDQVQQAIAVLVQALDRADQDRNRDLLRDVKPQELYEAGLTVMMRLVFLLAAEERGLLLLGEPRYDSFYAVSTLRMQLRAESKEILERRRSAWSRLLALFRAVFGGIDHPALHLPAMGGSLFDPDRFPFLEGRQAGTSWRIHAAEPLPIDDRTVLLLLDAIQTFEGRMLSYRALDVEQIGYVYEGLLERTVARVEDITLELEASASAKNARVTLGELESARLDGTSAVLKLLTDRSKRSLSAIEKGLAAVLDPRQSARLLSACRGDAELRDRLAPYMRLLRTDPWGYPLVHPKGAFVVVLGADRRETGTHYTPKNLTERIVEETLTPLVYDGPSKGLPRVDWKLKTPGELLSLKVCDPAMGSGAFLVQACRFLSARLVEAWAIEEAEGRVIDSNGEVHAPNTGVERIPPAVETRAEQARRIVAERCLYGVDLNPLAVELAKLSLWLVTLSKGRPFGFLDHNLRCGDSLLGISRLEHLTELSLDPSATKQGRLFGKAIEKAVADAVELRRKLHEIPIRDIRDVEAMATFDADARKKLETAELLADAFIGIVVGYESGNGIELRLASLAADADRVVKGDIGGLADLKSRTTADRSTAGLGQPDRRFFHWALAFPEVFQREDGGFDGVVGNPPFMGGKQMPTHLGPAYCDALKRSLTDSKGAADLVAYFFRRAFVLLSENGCLGLLATKSISETATRTVGLDPILDAGGTIYSAQVAIPWPGTASVFVSIVHIKKGVWSGERQLNGQASSTINSSLGCNVDFSAMQRLQHGIPYSQGVNLYGNAFIRTTSEVDILRGANPGIGRYLRRYVNGDVLNGTPEMNGDLLVIDFGDRDENEIVGCDQVVDELKVLVSKERSSQTRQIHEHRPWLHWDKRKGFLNSARQLPRIIACAIVQRHLVFEFVSPQHLYAHGLELFADPRASLFACLQSSIHEAWVRGASSKLGNSIRYTTSSGFDTFPFIGAALDCGPLATIGDRYSKERRHMAIDMGLGLTELYNRFHDPSESSFQIRSLRELHMEIDVAVSAAYGWNDLDLNHGFHEVPSLSENDRVRFTISETARLEVLRRLSDLNRRRYAEEVEQGLHEEKRVPQKSKRTTTPKKQLPLFDVPASTTAAPLISRAAETTAEHMTRPENLVIAYLKANPGWRSKSEILDKTAVAPNQWNAIISKLLELGFVERQGEKRGTKYRAKT